ncbi:MAG: DUF1071 domain-containing protein [Clostridia bacterium]|nr:DUF1071 domain-containing protein [Clostridia bacterium]
MSDNYFNVLNTVNVNEHTEKKNGLTYLSWAWAWAEVKKKFPEANYTIYEDQNGCIYWTDGRTCWVKTGVTINGVEHIEYLPVMDFKNKSIPLESITSFEVNKAIQRSLTKACARHGLGLYIYAGEDLPAEDEEEKARLEEEAKKPIDEQQVRTISGMIDESGASGSDIIAYINKKNGRSISAIKELNKKEYVEVIDILTKKINKKKEGK